MYVVIFRATLSAPDPDYATTAERMRTLAFSDYGCLAFQAVCEGDQEVALSYWPDTASIQAWRQNAEHRAAQDQGRRRWYSAWSVEVAHIERAYGSAKP